MKVKGCIEKLQITDKTSIWINTDVNEHSFKIELEKLMSEYSNQNVESLKLRKHFVSGVSLIFWTRRNVPPQSSHLYLYFGIIELPI